MWAGFETGRADQRRQINRILKAALKGTGPSVAITQVCAAEDIDREWPRVWTPDDTEADERSLSEVIAELQERLEEETESPVAQQLCRPFTKDELDNALKRLPYHKASDTDGVAAEVLRMLDPEKLAEEVLPLFNGLLEGEPMPPRLLLGRVALIHKGGAVADPLNYRPITVLTVLYRLFEHMLLVRIGPTLLEGVAAEQSGFQARRGAAQPALLLRLIKDRAECKGKRAYVAMLDLRKAFDSVPHGKLAERLAQTAVPAQLVLVLLQMLTAHVNILPTGAEVPIRRGVPEGAVLSPVCFWSLSNRWWRTSSGPARSRATWPACCWAWWRCCLQMTQCCWQRRHPLSTPSSLRHTGGLTLT